MRPSFKQGIWLAVFLLAVFGMSFPLAAKESDGAVAPPVKLSIETSPLIKGREVVIHFWLHDTRTGKLLMPQDLAQDAAHSFHVMLTDGALADFQNLYPTATGTPGVYVLAFTPRKDGAYRLWADIAPASTRENTRMSADLGITGTAGKTRKETQNYAAVQSLKFRLHLGESLKAGQIAKGSIEVTGPDGKPFAQLEPVTGAFAHILAVDEGLATVTEAEILLPKAGKGDLGGPAIPFRLRFAKAGFTKIFMHVRVTGCDIYAPFGVRVQP